MTYCAPLRLVLIALGVCIACAVPASSQTANVVVLYDERTSLPGLSALDDSLIRTLSSGSSEPVEIYREAMDLSRFGSESYLSLFRNYLRSKYEDKKVDVAVAVMGPSLDFLLENGDVVFPGTPVIFCGIDVRELDGRRLPPHVNGVFLKREFSPTLELALSLHPDTSRVVVVAGTSEFDARLVEEAKAEFRPYEDRLSFTYLTSLPLEEMLAEVSRLPPQTIVLYTTLFQDGAGEPFVPHDVAERLAAAANAPVYGFLDQYLGRGIVGGDLYSMAMHGEEAAKMALRVLAGTEPSEMSPIEPRTSAIMFDWRQLERWGLDAARLPDNTDLRFYEPSVWERYRLQILGALAIMLLQAGTIVALIVQNRRRRELSQELALERLELAHLSRSSQLGALSGAFAHELNQPLTSILANAQAGARLLREKKPNLKEIEEIFKDIIADDQRAAGVTGQLRQLMLKGETNFEQVDLNDIVASTIALAQSELVARRVHVDFRPGVGPMPVRGNAAQLQQIVLNLILNAADAMADLPIRDRRIDVEIRENEDGTRVLAVSDRGPGLPPEMREKAFEPFVSSKVNGLGLGLAICRTIAKAHGGTLRFDETMGRGARAVLTVPSDTR